MPKVIAMALNRWVGGEIRRPPVWKGKIEYFLNFMIFFLYGKRIFLFCPQSGGPIYGSLSPPASIKVGPPFCLKTGAGSFRK